ncbi:glycosyltransferase [bacterium]|nr:glycosyltransferase [bacterium]
MHILVLPSFYPSNSNEGLGSFFRDQVEALADNKHQVGVVYVGMKSLRQISPRNLVKNYFQFVKVEEKNWIEFRVKGWKIPGLVGEKMWLYLSQKVIDKYIEQFGNPDVIHVHNTFSGGLLALKNRKKNGTNYVITEHDSGFLFGSFTPRKMLQISDVYSNSFQVLSVSESLKRAMNKVTPKVDIKVVANMVDINVFKPKRKSASSVSPSFLAVGNLTKNKNHSLLIKAFYEVSKVHSDVSLVICGAGPEKLPLVKLIKRFGLEDRIQLKGFLKRRDLIEKFQNADCLVHTSNVETFGVVFIEAIACGLPFISTNSGGAQDIFQEGMGYLVEKDNVNELVEAMLFFLERKNKFKREDLRKIAVDTYSKRRVYEDLIANLEKGPS